ncbi:MAG: sensor histidine kinase [Bryobacteraceae bacterium]
MRTLLRVLVIGFAVVIALLAAAAVIGVHNARSITASAAGLVADQLVITRLLDEVEREQEALNAAFYRLSHTPENVDRAKVLAALDETGGQVAILVERARGGPDEAAWNALEHAVLDFSTEARQLLAGKKAPGFSSRDLFVRHEEVTTVVARLADLSYARAADTRRRVDAQTNSIVTESVLLIGGCLLVALVSAMVTVRIAARVFRQMEAQTSELSRVSFRMLETQEATARRFSHELHDELGGSLTAIKTNLTNASPLEDSIKLIDDAIANVRTLSQLLRPTILDDFGLDAGIRWLADRFSERTHIDVDYRSHFDGRLADETETHLFRIVQEALTNVARHANASRVTIFLRAENGNIHLTLSDNGRGLAQTSTEHTGMGLTGMTARARSAGGDCTISSTTGGGVTIDVTAPMEHK